MNLDNLVTHGLSSISVHMDTVLSRLLVLSVVGLLLIAISIILVVCIKLFTDLAIPGWASSISIALINFGVSLLILFSLLVTIRLNQRNNVQHPIAKIYGEFIDSVEHSGSTHAIRTI